MKILSNLLYFIRDLLVLALVVGLMAFAVTGVVFPDHSTQQALGNFLVAPFSIDLAIFQQDKGSHYYSLSPFNDYMISQQNERAALLSVDELQKNTFTVRQSHDFYSQLQQVFGTFFKQAGPEITFVGSHTVAYSTQITGNSMTVQRQFMLNPGENPQIVGSTIAYDPNDFIFDATGQLYLPRTISEIQAFTALTGQRLIPEVLSHRQVVKANPLFIYNQQLPGILVIEPSARQTVIVDQDYQLIEIPEAVSPANRTLDTITTELSISTFKTFSDIQHDIQGKGSP